MSVIVLASQRHSRNRTLRFHAFQGIYIFVVWLLLQWVIEPMFDWMPLPHGRPFNFMVNVLELSVMGAWIWMLIKTSQGQTFSLPFVGELAERSVDEQR